MLATGEMRLVRTSQACASLHRKLNKLLGNVPRQQLVEAAVRRRLYNSTTTEARIDRLLDLGCLAVSASGKTHGVILTDQHADMLEAVLEIGKLTRGRVVVSTAGVHVEAVGDVAVIYRDSRISQGGNRWKVTGTIKALHVHLAKHEAGQ